MTIASDAKAMNFDAKSWIDVYENVQLNVWGTQLIIFLPVSKLRKAQPKLLSNYSSQNKVNIHKFNDNTEFNTWRLALKLIAWWQS